MKAQNIQYFEKNYENLLDLTGSSDWKEQMEHEAESETYIAHFMSSLDSKLKVNLRRRTQKLCANQVNRMFHNEVPHFEGLLQ